MVLQAGEQRRRNGLAAALATNSSGLARLPPPQLFG